jgi:hypothetical protein
MARKGANMIPTDEELCRRYGLGPEAARLGAHLADPVTRQAMDLQRRMARMGVHIGLDAAKQIVQKEAGDR